jgi:hypothetical protein
LILRDERGNGDVSTAGLHPVNYDLKDRIMPLGSSTEFPSSFRYDARGWFPEPKMGT